MTQQSPRICILGGGFGGLYTALRLDQLPWQPPHKPEIVLVDQRDRFLFSPLLYELLTGELETWEIAPPFAELLANTSIRFQQAEVEAIDIETKTVQLNDATALTYDYLVLAMGGETPLEQPAGVVDYALPFRTLADAYQLQERLRRLEQSQQDKIRVAIVGGGYSGVELACKLAERLGDRGRLRIIETTDRILRNSPEFNREAATKALGDRHVWLDLDTSVTAIGPDTITLDYKGKVDTIPVDIVLWTVGTKVVDVIRDLPVKHNQRQQILVTPTLQVIDRPELLALGDLADSQDADGQKVPGTAQAAFQQAEFAGWNIWAMANNRPLLPFRYTPLGEMMTLGTSNATLAGLGVKLDGPAAYIARRLLYLYRMPTLDHQLKVGLNWMAQPIRDLLSHG
jgi:demethylphylloquinone reductase